VLVPQGMVRMGRAANEAPGTGLRTWRGAVTALVAFVVVLAGCGSKTSFKVQSVTHSTSTTTRAPGTTPTTVPLTRYVVQRGDTLGAIARRFRITIGAIVFVNRMADPNRVTAWEALLIPPRPPLRLVVSPSVGPPGGAFHFTLTGAAPAETIRFEIDSPTGKYRGPAHIASADGMVTASYQSAGGGLYSAGAPTGIYEVIATGDQGTTARTVFAVDTPSTTPETRVMNHGAVNHAIGRRSHWQVPLA